MRIQSLLGAISVGGPTSPLTAPQQLWPGTLTSTSFFLVIWPPNDGTVPDGYNLYRSDVSGKLNTSGLIVPRYWGAGSAAAPSIQYAAFADTTLSLSTTYTYFATAVTGSSESPPSPTLTVTTLAGNTTATTLPTPPTDPATYFPAYALPTLVSTATHTVWTATQNLAAANTGTAGAGTDNGFGKLSVNCSLNFALSNAVAGDVIVMSSGLTYLSNNIANSAAFSASGGSASGYIYVISDQDPAFNSSGRLTPYSFVTTLRHTTFTATATVTAGSTSLTLSAPFTETSGWYKTEFTSTVLPDPVAKSGFETRQALYQNGQTSVVWNVGLLSDKKASFSVGVGNHVSPWDAGIPIGPANTTNAAPTMPTIQFSQNGLGGNGGIGLFVNGTNYRFVGINIQTKPSWLNQTNVLTAGAIIGGTGNILDRCVIGRDNTNASTLSYFGRSVQSSGTNITLHQCYLYGADGGPGSGDSQGIIMSSSGPLCAENCYIEAVSENFMAGGSRVAQANQPHDVTLRYNWTHKPTAWQQVTTPNNLSPFAPVSLSRRMKNHYELKCCTRAAWYGNVHQNCAATQASQGQQGRCYVLTPRDQVSATSNRGITSITWAAGVATATSSVTGVLPPVGTMFSTTIANCPVAGYNGVVVATVTGALTFTYPLAVNPGSSAGAFNGYLLAPQSGGMWQIISDVDVHDNQCYGFGSGGTIADHIDYNPVLYTTRVRFANNQIWINPAMTDDVNSPTPMVGIYIQGQVPDCTFDHNTIIGVPQNYGYSLQGVSQPMIGLESTQSGSPNTLVERWTVTNNIIDGGTGGQIVAGSQFNPPNAGATGGTFVQFSFSNVVWNKNLFVLDTSSGTNAFPGTTFNPVAYASVGFSNFQGNTVMPASSSDWNVVGGTTGCNGGSCATASTTGGAIGTFFSSLVLANDQFPRTYLNMVGGSPGILASGNTNAGVPFATVAAQSHFVSMGTSLGYESGVGTTVQALVSGWKSAAAGHGITLRAMIYIPGGSAYYPQSGAPGQNFWLAHALAAGNMWLYNNVAGTGVTNLQTYAGFATAEAFPLFTAANTKTVPSFTFNGKTGVNVGMNVWNVEAQYYWDVFSRGLAVSTYGETAGQAACPALDGLFLDNMMSVAAPHFFSTTTSTWNGQGTTPVANSSVLPATIQQGEQKLVQALQAQQPNILLVANCDFPNQLPTMDNSYKGLFSALFSEDVIGNLEAFQSSPGSFMAALIAAEPIISSGGTLIFHQVQSPGAVNNLTGNQSTWTATQWRGVRFGIACAMMRNWHYALNCGVNNYSAVGLLDEQVQTVSGTPNWGWLSAGTQRLDPPQSAAFANGVWRRRFPNGWVLWNPRGNGIQVVIIPSTLARISHRTDGPGGTGYGDATVNNGATGATTVTLQDADGLFLIGTG